VSDVLVPTTGSADVATPSNNDVYPAAPPGRAVSQAVEAEEVRQGGVG
jgi:hypothetical protein